MAVYQGEYGHPYPRVDQYGNPVPPVDQYGNPVPREPASGLGSTAPPYSAGDTVAVHVTAPVEYGDTASAGYPHDGMGSGGITAPGGVAYPSGGVAPGETALAYEGMVGGGVGGAHLQPTREEHTFGPGAQLQPTKEDHTTLGEKLRRSGSSSSSSELRNMLDDGQDLGAPDAILINGRAPYRYDSAHWFRMAFRTVRVEL